MMKGNKNLQKWMLTRLNLLLSSVLALLGFSSCEGIDGPGDYPCLYGTPYTHFDVKGTVQNADGQVLNGVNVTVKSVYKGEGVEYPQQIDIVETGADGKYKSFGSWSGFNERYTLRVVVDDPSGVYESDSTDVKLDRTTEGENEWCWGTDLGTADFTLKKK